MIPHENERDLQEVPDNIKENLDIRPVKWIDEVLAIALERLPEPSTMMPISQGLKVSGRAMKQSRIRGR